MTMENNPAYKELKETLDNIEKRVQEKLTDIKDDAAKLQKENEELKKKLTFDESYEKLQDFINALKQENAELKMKLSATENLVDVAIDCRTHQIQFTSHHLEEGEPVHQIMFEGFVIILSQEQWERITQ